MTRPVTRSRRTGAVVLVVVLAGVIALSGCRADDAEGVEEPEGAGAEWISDAERATAELPELAGPYAGEVRVDGSLRPPTNSWIAGAVFGDGAHPVFTGVLSVNVDDDGLRLGLPRVSAVERTIFGSARQDVSIGLDAEDVRLTRLDALSATLEFSADGAALGSVTMATGWPYVQYDADVDQTIALPGLSDEEEPQVVVDGVTYGIVTDGDVATGSVTLGAGETLMVHAAPAGASEEDRSLLRARSVPLDATEVEYAVHGAEEVSTRYRLTTRGGEPTLFVARPHQDLGEPALSVGYDLLYGTGTVHEGTEFAFTLPQVEAADALDLSSLDDDERAQLAATLDADAAALQFDAGDSYYAGKQLYRAAMLYAIADDLGHDETAAGILEQMRDEFDQWFDPRGCVGRSTKCLVYDPVLGGITGYAPAYGSDEFNDHHFHYGYFLYAIGVVSGRVDGFADDYRAVVDAIALDIAAPQESDLFPQRRSFDDYTGHSWASGTSPFDDGNNQESVSEAVNAWAGLLLWARASNNPELIEEATWMLSTETVAAQTYWLTDEHPAGFEAPFTALNWGGKRDYATFFDASPSAILGILLIPMSPSTHFLPADPETSRAWVRSALGDDLGDIAGLPLVDYVLMLAADVDREAALSALEAFPDASIDNANSRTYLTAWILSRET